MLFDDSFSPSDVVRLVRKIAPGAAKTSPSVEDWRGTVFLSMEARQPRGDLGGGSPT